MIRVSRLGIKNYILAFLFICIYSCQMCLAAEQPVKVSFESVHNEQRTLSRDFYIKKLLFTCGQINGAYHGLNDLVSVFHLVKKKKVAVTVESLQSQLFALKVSLTEKPYIIRHIADSIKECENNLSNFPLGFPDSPEGPEKISDEFYKMASHLENLQINHKLDSIPALRKESERVVFEIFWTDGEKMRSLASDMLSYLRVYHKEYIPFDVF